MRKILSLFLISIIASCQPKECKERLSSIYDFEIPLEITPVKEQYQIGDTIRIYSEFNGQEVYDINSAKKYDLVDFEILPFAWFSQIDTLPIIGGFETNFVVANEKFNPRFVEHTTITKTLNLDFFRASERIQLEYLIVLNTPGIYCLLNCPLVIDGNQDFPERCRDSHAQAHTKKTTSIADRKELLEICQDASLKKELTNDFESCGGFCFEVK